MHSHITAAVDKMCDNEEYQNDRLVLGNNMGNLPTVYVTQNRASESFFYILNLNPHKASVSDH